MSEQKPTLSLLDTTLIVSGSMIGSGIFIVSSEMARTVGSAGWLLLCWVLTGVHNIQPDVPPENVCAMFRAGKGCGYE